jgi:AcrR family transcriptional regulator
MPRVSQEHRDQRRQQILDAARRCFIREGFHQTSMTDILTEAGLSAGAVYGYFKSKNEIIAAIAEDVIGQITQLLEPIFTQEPPPRLAEAIRQGLSQTNDIAFGPEGFAQLAPQVWLQSAADHRRPARRRHLDRPDRPRLLGGRRLLHRRQRGDRQAR